MTSGKVVLSVLAGLAAGATLGILFAPDKGSSTRKKIAQKRDAYVDELGEKINEFVDGMNNTIAKVRREAAQRIDGGRARIDDLEEELASVTNSKMRMTK